MSIVVSGTIEGILDHVKRWTSSDRLRLARMILETLELPDAGEPQNTESLKDLIGLLKTEAPPPTDDECRAILEEELIKKHHR
jgi:hypothetical protein